MTRILIVEDEERIVSFLEKGLRAGGYSTVSVVSGTEALAVARDDAFDLVVLDLGLPMLDGLDVLRALRRRGEHMPIIVLSARDGVADTVAALEGGADDYVTKPFRFEELLARIRLRLRDAVASEPTILHAGGITLDLRSRRASVASRRTRRRAANGRADGARVRAHRDAAPPCRPGAVPRATPLPRVGVRLRPRLERGRGVHPLHPPQARHGRDRDGPGDGLPAP